MIDVDALARLQEASFARAEGGLRSSWPRESGMDAEQLRSFLERHRYAVLATTSAQRRPVARPVAFTVLGASFWCATVAGARLRNLEQTPWAPRMPSEYLPGHIYFVQGSLDGPSDTDFAGEWFGFTGKEDMVMFGSSYPHWQCGDIHKLPKALSAEQREKLCWRNAANLYGIVVSVDLAAS